VWWKLTHLSATSRDRTLLSTSTPSYCGPPARKWCPGVPITKGVLWGTVEVSGLLEFFNEFLRAFKDLKDFIKC